MFANWLFRHSEVHSKFDVKLDGTKAGSWREVICL